MRHPLPTVAGLVLAAAFSGVSFPGSVSAQTPAAALTGQVSSTEEAAMEGVLVSATKSGSNVTVTVVSGADGRYSFPSGRLAPGQYTLNVRAIGYELDQPEAVEVPGSENRNPGSQARQGQGSRRAVVEWRMDGKHSRHRPAKGSSAQLRRLPHGRTHHALEIRQRGVPHRNSAAHAKLRAAELADPSAIAPRRTPDGRARRRPHRGVSRGGGLSEHAQPQQDGKMGLSAQDVCATEGPGDTGDLHGIRSAAPGSRAA